MTKARKVKTPVVHVVLDTNAIFTEAADRLISDSISNFILSETKSLGLEIHWYLPSIVRMERHNQMLERGVGLLIPLAKLEKLLGHNLNMTPDILESRVVVAIDRQVKLHNLNEAKVDYNLVDWGDIVSKAASKKPPFTSGSSEKGFKDAIVLECYVQLANSLPRSPKTCRIAFLTDDSILKQAADARTNPLKNVSVVSNLNELKTLLNSIAAQLDQEDIITIINKARDMFFVRSATDTLFQKWNISGQIRTDLGNIIFQPPDIGFNVSTKRTLISPPTFILKEGQKVVFQSVITYELEADKSVLDPAQLNLSALGSRNFLTELTTPRDSTAQFATSDKKQSLADFFVNRVDGSKVTAKPQTSLGIFGVNTDKFVTVKRSGIYAVNINWAGTLNRIGNLVAPELLDITLSAGSWSD